MKKFIRFLVCVFCGVLLAIGFVACTPDEEATYSVTIAEMQNGRVEADVTSAKDGDTVTLTVTPDEGYETATLLMNETALTVSESTATFTMPAKDVTISATFAETVVEIPAKVSEDVPAKTAFEIEATSVRSPAKGVWAFTFGANTLDISVWVEDEFLLADKDSVKAYFGVAGFDRQLGENNLAVQVFANGTVKTYKVTDGAYAEAALDGVTAYVQEWALAGSLEVIGFKATMKISYTTLGVTVETAKGGVTMVPSHTNANYETIAPMETKLEGDYKIEKPNTYVVLTNDNRYSENDLMYATGQLGSAGTMNAGAYWDLEQDYFPEEAEYADRVVTLEGHDNADNNLFFHNTRGAEQMYVEATFKVTKIHNTQERYGKFGLMFFNGASRSGVFYYVDAYVGEQTVNLNNIVGTELGYNQAANGWNNVWNTIPDTENSFDLSAKTVTLKMAYKNNMLYFYCGDNFVMARPYMGGTQAVIGIKSFGYGLEVTDYYSTTDANDAKLIAHTPADTAKEIEILFAGDQYMANWADYRSAAIEGSKANEGVVAATIADWTAKINSMKVLYKPEHIVFHVGMNDLNNGATVQAAYGDIESLISAYHSAFPTANLYWVSLVPNMTFKDKAADYVALNNLMRGLAESDALLEYIDAATAFTVNGGARTNMFQDGLHFNTEFGYPLWGKLIIEALGGDRAEGTQMGDNAEGYAYSGGWTFEENCAVAVNVGTGEQAIWYKDMQYAADLYLEAEVYAPRNTGEDAYPKAGLILRNDSFTIFAYADFADTNGSDCMMNIVYRPNVSGAVEVTGAWQWNDQGNGSYGKSIANGFVKIAIAKLDNTVYMLCEDEVVATFEVPGMTADDEFIAGALNFNRRMEIKNAQALTDEVEVANKLGIEKIPTVSFDDVTALGGGSAEHQPSNLTYTVTEYGKTFTSTGTLAYARLYVIKTGGYVVVLNGNEVTATPMSQKNGQITSYVYNVATLLNEGENTLKILTADPNTAIKAKLVLGYENETETTIVTDNTWTKAGSEVTLPEKPTYYFLGSSVTYGSANGGSSFVEEVSKTLGYNCVKEAVSGTTLVDNGSNSYIKRMKTLPTNGNVERLIVQLSTNDVTQNLPFGMIASGTELSNFDTSTVLGAIEYIIAYAKQTWGCEVIFYTNPDYNNVRYEALVNELYKVQEKWGIGILDFYYYQDMEALDDATLKSYMSDDIHPNAKGYEWMGEVFSEYLQNELEKAIIREYLED